MSDYSLIKAIQEGKIKEKPSGIKYRHYDIIINNKNASVLIPLRECDLFERNINNLEEITKIILKKLLREHRGILQRD
mgnify:CR=1 FL=1